MYTRSSRHITHMQIGSTAITVNQYEIARISLRPNLELVAPTSFTSAFIHFFKVNMLTFQILTDKYCCGFDILAFKFNAKRIISGRKRDKEHRTSTSQGIKDSEPLGTASSVMPSKKCRIQ